MLGLLIFFIFVTVSLLVALYYSKRSLKHDDAVNLKTLSMLYNEYVNDFYMQTKPTSKGFSVTFTHVEREYKLIYISSPMEFFMMYSTDEKKFNARHQIKYNRSLTISDIRKHLNTINTGKVAIPVGE